MKRSLKNRLGMEKSPYLRQHKDNPVHWYPWSPEAFDAARSENKPVFLSIGYATCHWCHVMAHESFEDPEVAHILNEKFIAVKVDREERPDIDHIYMNTTQLLTGSGGWPLTIITTPDRKPFFAATYVPKQNRYGIIGLIELLNIIVEKWHMHSDRLTAQSKQITAVLQQLNMPDKRHHATASLLDDAATRLSQRYDSDYGGFSSETKFPTPHTLIFLLRYFQRTQRSEIRQMVEHTMRHMRAGGIFDQLGYGFHRYATDSQWRVPHFEKMLYDQALLMWAYVEAYQATEDLIYATVATEIAHYVTTRLQAPNGAFYSAEDADSEGFEGKYYLWHYHELNEILTADALWFNQLFHVRETGNFHAHATPAQTNILYIDESQIDVFLKNQKHHPNFKSAVKRLRHARRDRIPPLLDDKVLTDWNGLMIGALARAGRLLNQPELIHAAERAAAFIRSTLRRNDGSLYHRFRDKEAKINGQLDDYAFLTFGLIELHQSTLHSSYLEWALELCKKTRELFRSDNGAYFLSASDTSDLIVRSQAFYDGALPSGNSVMMDNLVRLARITGDSQIERDTYQLADAIASHATHAPDAYTHFLSGLQFALGPSVEVVVVGDADDPRTTALLEAVQAADKETYFPNKVLLLKNQTNREQINRLAPFTQEMVPLNGCPTAYICMNQACTTPIQSPEELKSQMTKVINSNNRQ